MTRARGAALLLLLPLWADLARAQPEQTDEDAPLAPDAPDAPDEAQAPDEPAVPDVEPESSDEPAAPDDPSEAPEVPVDEPLPPAPPPPERQEVAAPAAEPAPPPEESRRETSAARAPRLPGVDLERSRAQWRADDSRPSRRAWRPSPEQGDGDFAGTFDRAPALHWRIELPGDPLNSVTHSEYSRPVVLGGDLLVGSAKGRGLYRFSRGSGTLLQVYPTTAAVQGEALVVDDRVYFSDIDGGTWCYTLDGDLLWTWRGTAPTLVRPTYTDGLIYVTNVDDLAVALDADSGELVWRYQARRDLMREAELRLYAAPPAVPLDDVVVLGFSDGSLVGVDRRTGEERWARRIGEGRYPDIVAAPVPWQDDLYASAYFEPFVAMDFESQVVRWRADVGGAFGVVIDDRAAPAVVYHPGSDGRLRAYSALTGAERWTWESGTTGAITAPVITDAGLVVGSSEGGVFLVDEATGALKWRFAAPYRLSGMSAPAVVEGRQLLFVTNAGHLYSMLAPRPTEAAARLWPAAPAERVRSRWATRSRRLQQAADEAALPPTEDLPQPAPTPQFVPRDPLAPPAAPLEPEEPVDGQEEREPGDSPTEPLDAAPDSPVEPETPVEPATPQVEPETPDDAPAPEPAPAPAPAE